MGTENVMIRQKFRPAFTIVELIVVISVIAILAGITLVSYGAWRNSTTTSSVKSDLAQAASTMESARTFNNSYPAAIPSTFIASDGITIALASSDAKSYCINGSSVSIPSIKYYIDNTIHASGAATGTCATRAIAQTPSPVTNVAFIAGSSQINVTWSLAIPNYAAQYTAQCAQDPSFITGVIQTTVSGATQTSGVVTGANATTTYYCRVKAINANGQSAWSGPGSGDTQQTGCGDTNQYGTFPDCYDYDSLPVATSIEGYWPTAPAGYLLEDGSAVSRTTYADLFAVVGTTYGAGNGSTTFNLPDSRGRVSVNLNTADTQFATLGQKYGEKTHLLTLAELPAHNHGPGTDNGSYVTPAGSYYGLGTAGGLTYTGGSGAHNVIQPSIVKRTAIKFRPAPGSQSLSPAATSIEGYWTSATVPPTGYLFEDGAAVSRTTYADLFAAIGTTYGAGNGSTTFNLPDSRGRVGVNLSTAEAEFAAMGQKYGEKTHLLTIAEMPSHNHGSGTNGVSYLTPLGSNYGLTAPLPAVNAGGGQAHNVIQPSMVKRFAIKFTAPSGTVAASARGTSVEGYWNSVPTGYLYEDGSAVSRTTYADLFAVIGTTYGAGNGSTTFNIPDSRGRAGVNINSADAEFATMGQKYGEKAHTLTIAEMPSHVHNYGATGTYVTPAGDYYGIGTTVATAMVGGSGAHNVIQPSIVKRFIIKF